MKYSLRELYFYSVSFVMLLILVLGVYQLIDAGMTFWEPRYEPPVYESKLRLEEEIRQKYPALEEGEIKERVERQMEEMAENEKERQAYYRWRNLVRAAALVLISLPLYLYHWRKVRSGGAKSNLD